MISLCRYTALLSPYLRILHSSKGSFDGNVGGDFEGICEYTEVRFISDKQRRVLTGVYTCNYSPTHTLPGGFCDSPHIQ